MRLARLIAAPYSGAAVARAEERFSKLENIMGKGHANRHIEAKVRQTLNRGGFTKTGRAQYALPI